jgi:antitoxin HicB
VARQYRFSVILEPQASGGFTALVPALPEVVTEGDSESEALRMAEEAIRMVLEHRRRHDLAIPADVIPAVRHVTVAAAE